jgi:glutaminase
MKSLMRTLSGAVRRMLAAAAIMLVAAQTVAAQTAADVQRVVNAAYDKYKTLQEGKNADYIPALAKVDPNVYGIAVVTPDGQVFTAGDLSTEVSIQSVSKVFTMAYVFQHKGEKALEDNIGVDATGQPFNSIVAIEQYKGKEMNPLVNAGAITTTSLIDGSSKEDIWNTIIGLMSDFAGRQLGVNQEVYESEAATNQRNQAIAQLMFAYEHIKSDPMRATDLYTKQCAISVNARDLAVMAATLAAGGRNPITNKQVIPAELVPGVLAVMATAGLYDDSGKWLFATGLPAKSGVGGGLIAVSPGKFGIAVVSPPLDGAGNSVRGQKAITDISNALGGNPFAVSTRATASRKNPEKK